MELVLPPTHSLAIPTMLLNLCHLKKKSERIVEEFQKKYTKDDIIILIRKCEASNKWV